MREELILYLKEKIRDCLLDLEKILIEKSNVLIDMDNYSSSEMDKAIQELQERKLARKSEIFAYEEILWYVENRR